MTRRFRGAALVLVLLSAALVGCGGKRGRADLRAIRGAEEMYAEGLALIEQGKARKARQVLQRVQFSARNRAEIEPLVRLAVADATYYQGDDLSLIDARSLYLDFVTLYGDHPRAPYAQLQAGLCSLAQVNHPARDQTQTLVAIRDLEEVVRRYPTSAYVPAALAKIREAQALLAEHEYIVGRFYMKKKAYQAGIDRMRGLLIDYPTYPEKDKVYYWIGEAMLRQDNDDEGRLYLEKILADYPGSEYASKAAKSLSKRGIEPSPDVAPAGRSGAS